MKCVLEKFGDDIDEGDIFVANDPHTAGGTHLPDINYAMPVFGDGEIVAFICNIAHHADIGGMVPGSMAGGMSEIYQEGFAHSRGQAVSQRRVAAGYHGHHVVECAGS